MLGIPQSQTKTAARPILGNAVITTRKMGVLEHSVHFIVALWHVLFLICIDVFGPCCVYISNIVYQSIFSQASQIWIHPKSSFFMYTRHSQLFLISGDPEIFHFPVSPWKSRLVGICQWWELSELGLTGVLSSSWRCYPKHRPAEELKKIIKVFFWVFYSQLFSTDKIIHTSLNSSLNHHYYGQVWRCTLTLLPVCCMLFIIFIKQLIYLLILFILLMMCWNERNLTVKFLGEPSWFFKILTLWSLSVTHRK